MDSIRRQPYPGEFIYVNRNAGTRSRQKVLLRHRLASRSALADTAVDRHKFERYNRSPVTDGKSSFYKNDEGRAVMSER
jgi:hypothetical protein